MRSIVQEDMSRCYVCGTTYNLHTHEIFFGSANRKKSIQYGLQVRLCGEHHNLSSMGVHFNNDLNTKLKKEGQTKFEETYPNLNFKEIFGKNYL